MRCLNFSNKKNLLFFLLFAHSFLNGAGSIELFKKIKDLYNQAEYLAIRKFLQSMAQEQNELYNRMKKDIFFNPDFKDSLEKEVILGLPVDVLKIPSGEKELFYQIVSLTYQFGEYSWHGVLLYKRIHELVDKIQDSDFREYMKNLINFNAKTASIGLIENASLTEKIKENELKYISSFKEFLVKASEQHNFIDLGSPVFFKQNLFKEIGEVIHEYEKDQFNLQKNYANLVNKYTKQSKNWPKDYPKSLPDLDELVNEIEVNFSNWKIKKLKEEISRFEDPKEAVGQDFLPKEFLEKEKKRKKLAQKLKKQKKKKAQQVQKKEAEYLIGIKEKKAREAELKKESKEEELEEKKIAPEKKEFDEVSFYNKKYKSSDGSKVVSITDRVIKIDDPRNNALITLIKVKDTDRKKPEGLERAKRVQSWFDNSIQTLVERGDLQKEVKRKELPWDLEYKIRTHAFADMVDAFVDRYGVDSEYIDKKNKKILNKVIPGEIEFTDKFDQKTNKPLRITGLFAYGKLPNTDKWYHRFFTRKPFNDQLEEFMRTGKWIVEETQS